MNLPLLIHSSNSLTGYGTWKRGRTSSCSKRLLSTLRKSSSKSTISRRFARVRQKRRTLFSVIWDGQDSLVEITSSSKSSARSIQSYLLTIPIPMSPHQLDSCLTTSTPLSLNDLLHHLVAPLPIQSLLISSLSNNPEPSDKQWNPSAKTLIPSSLSKRNLPASTRRPSDSRPPTVPFLLHR